MTLNIGAERRSPPIATATPDRSWRVRRDPDPARGKEQPRVGDISFYWLVRGINSGKLYQPDARSPFALQLSASEQQVFAERLQGTVALYDGAFQTTVTQDSDGNRTQTVVGSYKNTRFGKPAIVIRNDGSVQRVEHVWIPPPPPSA